MLSTSSPIEKALVKKNVLGYLRSIVGSYLSERFLTYRSRGTSRARGGNKKISIGFGPRTDPVKHVAAMPMLIECSIVCG